MIENDGTSALPEAPPGADNGLVHRPYVLGLRGPRRPGADEPDQGPGNGAAVRRDPRAEGDRRRDEGGEAPERRAQVLPRLRPRPDGDGRRDVAPREEHAEGHRLRRGLVEEPRSAHAGGGRGDPPPHGRVQGEAEAEVHLRARREGEDRRRALQGVHRGRRGDQHRALDAPRPRHDLRPPTPVELEFVQVQKL